MKTIQMFTSKIEMETGGQGLSFAPSTTKFGQKFMNLRQNKF